MGGNTTIAGLGRAALVLQRGDTVVRAWRVGTVLQALVTRTEGPARAWLRIGGAEVPVRTHGPLEAGRTLALRVAAVQPQVVLEPLPRSRSTATTAAHAAAWRGALPRQAPLARALPPLLRAAAPSADPRAALPPPVRAALGAVAASVAGAERLADARTLQQAVHASGVFLESSLAGRGAPPPGDLKLALARLAAALRAAPAPAPEPGRAPAETDPAPPAARQPGRVEPGSRPVPSPHPTPSFPPRAQETGPPRGPPIRSEPGMRALADAAETALARITARQLESLPRGETEPPRWSLELPVRLGDGTQLGTLAMRIEPHPSAEERPSAARPSPSRRWRVSLALDLGAAGAVHAGILLEGERVAVRLTADRDVTAERLRAALDRLAAGLRARGLEPTGLEAARGAVRVPEPLPGGSTPDAGPLLEEEA